MAFRKVVGTIISVKGTCNAGHKVGDKFDLTAPKSAGLCGSFFHNLFPNLLVLQAGGNMGEDPEKITIYCPERGENEVVIELQRLK